MHAMYAFFYIIDADCGVQNFVQMMPHTQEEAHAASYGNSVSMHEIPQAGKTFYTYQYMQVVGSSCLYT